MFLEKHLRFFRRYTFRIAARAKLGPALPMVGKKDEYSVLDALRLAERSNKLRAKQPNGDDVEIAAIRHEPKSGVLTLLFHRTSPDAADPSYRKKVKQSVALRHSKKLQGEDQAVSAHLVLRTKSTSPGLYQAALEEIPGLSMSVIKPIIAAALREYPYGFKNRTGEEQETYSAIKAEGVKSEALSNALKKQGSLDYLVLTRSNAPDAPDSDGIAEPQSERVRYKIVGDPRSEGWKAAFRDFISRAREADWDDISIQISLEDDRHRTIKIDRAEEASEILFVRSEQVRVSKELKPCTADVLDELVKAAITLIEKPQ